MANQIITVPFHGHSLFVVEHNGQPYTPMKTIVEGMGLAWQAQHRKLSENTARWGITEMVMQMSGDDQQRSVSCIPLRKLPGWLMTIHPNKIKNLETRANVVMYQNEADDALWDYWTKGIAINPRPYSRNPTDSLTIEQADVLRNLLTDATKRLPKEQQGAAIMRGWSKLKSHFKVAYRDIPQSEFTEAVSIIARHVASGDHLECEDFGSERCGPSALSGSSKEQADIAMQSIVGKQFLMTVVQRNDGKMFHYMKHVHDDAFLLCPGDIPWLLDKYNMVAIQRSAAQGIAASLGHYAN